MSVRTAGGSARTCDVPGTLELGIAVDSRGRAGEPLRVPLSVPTGPVLLTGAADEVAQAVTGLLRQLSAAGIPWLRVGRRPARTPDPSAVTVVDLTDARGIPLTIDPFLPEPGFPEIAHADALGALLEAVFGPPGPYRDVLAVALRGLYAARAPDEPAPATSQVERAVRAAVRELGYGTAAEETLREFVAGRLGRLRGPATGLLLGGGYPVDMAELVRRDVDLVTGDGGGAVAAGGGAGGVGGAVGAVGGAGGRALMAGAVALRIAEHARRFPRTAASAPRHVLILEEAGPLLRGSRAVHQMGRLLSEAGARGAGIVVTEHTLAPVAPWLADGAALTIARESGTDPAQVIPVPRSRIAPEARTAPRQPSAAGLIGRHMGSRRAGQPCVRDEITAAMTLVGVPGPEAAWLRLWARTLLLAFLTGHPLPAVPPPLRTAAAAFRPRVMECALAVIAERAVAERAPAVRGCFPVAALTRALTEVGAGLLAGRDGPAVAGQVWVIPQLRWAHEATRVGWARVPAPPAAPRRGTVRPGDLAPPLDFAIAGLPDWRGMLAKDRLRALLRHPLSLEVAPNHRAAAVALFGECGQEAFEVALTADLAVAFPSSRTIPVTAPSVRSDAVPPVSAAVSPLYEAARLMDCAGDWLVTVMRWTMNG